MAWSAATSIVLGGPPHAPQCPAETGVPPVVTAPGQAARLAAFEPLGQPDAARREALRAEVANDGNTLIWFQLVPETTDAGPMEQGPVGPDALTPQIVLPPPDADSTAETTASFAGLLADVVNDHRRFYSLGNMAALGAGVGIAAAMANTSADERIRHTYRENIPWSRSNPYWRTFHAPKVLGDGYLVFPTVAGTAVLGAAFEEGTLAQTVGDWGGRSLRAYGVGVPMLLGLQYTIGASRPNETIHGSSWTPFRDNNGVSGHAFIGAVPFFTAAKMVDSPLWKTAFYAGSILPGLSRINDGEHYTSQVLLGWWLAYLSAVAVDRTNMAHPNWSIGPMPMSEGIGLGVEWRR